MAYSKEFLSLTHSNDFMDFWKILNEFAKSHDLPEPLYREARDWFLEYQVITNHRKQRA